MKRWQDIIDQEPDYEAQISKAKKTWGKNNKTFDEVKAKLRLMSNSTYRCHYCEDSYSDEIEHIFPKDIYPEKTFVWVNYLYSCGPCNGPKSNQFSLITAESQLLNVTPPRPLPPGHQFIRPPELLPALINPREEDPTQFIELDIIDTFRFVPLNNLGIVETLRAKFTIDLLRLNDREILIQSRKNAYGNYKARLKEYVASKMDNATQAVLNELIAGITMEVHPSVWFEMKRLQGFIEELRDLFTQAPEALDWE